MKAKFVNETIVSDIDYSNLKKGLDFNILTEPEEILPGQIWYGYVSPHDNLRDSKKCYLVKIIGDDGVSIIYTKKLSLLSSPDYGPNYLIQDFIEYFKLTDLD